MNMNLRAADAWFLARKPAYLSYSTVSSTFLGIGMLLIVTEVLLFDYVGGLANSSFTTRRIIGYHLFFSELWFIIVGNVLLLLMIGSNRFRISRYIVIESQPVFLVLGVYSLWFVYGSLAGNSWALQEFREVVFTAFSLPPILYFASHLSARQLLGKFVAPVTLVLPVASAFGAHNSALIFGTFIVGYFTLKLLYKSTWAILGLGLVSLSFVLKFAKPMVVLFAFCLTASFLLAAYLNPKSVNWILSKFKMKIVFIGLLIILALLAVIAIVNAWSGGAIEEIIRWYFLKERLTASGETIYADVSGGRFAIWQAAIESWTERPVFGYGLGAEVEAYSKGWVTKVQFHSYLIQATHNTGLIGLSLIAGGWSVWLIRSFRKVFLVQNIEDKIMLGSMLVYVLGIFFYGLYGHSLSYPPNALFFWLCVGFLCALRRPVNYRVKS